MFGLKERKTARQVAVLAVAGVFAAGCASKGPLTTDQKIGGCIGTVAVGAVLGAIIGNASGGGKGNAAKGAVIGAALGAGACGVWLAFEDERDRRMLAESQLKAAKEGRVSRNEWVGKDGRRRSVLATPGQESLVKVARQSAPAEERMCRPVSVAASVDSNTETLEVLYCRTPEGDYVPETREA